MKTAKWFLVSGAVLLLVANTYAAADNSDLSRLSYDIFGIYATHDKDGESDGQFGLGLGLNYFFTENIGVGVDSYVDGIEWPYLLNASGIYRFTQLKPIVPYAYGGFGRQWSHAPQWMGHFGGGAEYELGKSHALFADARYVLPTDTANYTVIRVGIRLGF